MNRQPHSHTTAIRTLTRTVSHLSTKETAMNRRNATVRLTTVLVALFALLALSACAVQSPFQTAGSVTVLPSEPGPMMTSGDQISSRQQLADYQAGLSSIAPVVTAPKAAVNGTQIVNRQQLADYQASLSNSAPVVAAPKAAVNDTQISNRQQLADYQASLPLYTAAKRTANAGVQQIHDRQALADYQATLR